MTNNPIVFPGLGIELDIDRVAFTLFGQPIYWYGIIIALGFVLAAAYCLRRSRKMGLDPDNLLDGLLIAVPAAIIGARLYYVVFNAQLFDASSTANPQKFYEIWKGGLAIYGGIIFAVIAGVLYARIRKVRIGALLDVAALGLLIGQCIGRLGNFINREAFGVETTLPWRMEINVSEMNGVAIQTARMAVHPAFLYESLWNLIGFIVLHFYAKKRRFFGEIFLLYIGWYGLGRGFIEGLRTDSLMFFDTGIRVSQLLGFVTFLLAAGLLVYLYIYRMPRMERPVFGSMPDDLAGYKQKQPVKKAAANQSESKSILETDSDANDNTASSSDTPENAPASADEAMAETLEADRATAENVAQDATEIAEDTNRQD